MTPVDPRFPHDALPLGAEFETLFSPEPTVGTGWVWIRFRVVSWYNPIVHQQQRGYADVGRRDATEEERGR
jgi:hypothetical protein